MKLKNNNINHSLDANKKIELERYDDEAIKQDLASQSADYKLGSDSVEKFLRAPYIFYEAMVRGEILKVTKRSLCLEIGAGYGLYSGAILETGADLIASDISGVALEVLRKNFKKYPNLATKIADMESLPFDNDHFDFVFSAGSLSYGDERLVFNEIRRVLKPSGIFVCVDSFGHNPIYRLNRYFHYLRGNRTKIVLTRIPRESTIQLTREVFSEVKVSYFGAFSFLAPVLCIFCGGDKVARFLDKIDDLIQVKKLAFKIVMIAKK